MKRFFACVCLLIAFSCSKINESSIPYYRVYLTLDLRYQDKDLVGLYNVKSFTSPRNAAESTGFSGVFVVCGNNNVYYAYDLCCPHEAEKSVRVVPDLAGGAKCPQCGTEFSTAYGSGAPVKGPSKYALRRYNVTPRGQELIVTN